MLVADDIRVQKTKNKGLIWILEQPIGFIRALSTLEILKLVKQACSKI